MKKKLCLFLAILMVISVMPITAFAGEGAIQEISFAPVNGSKVIYEYTNCDHVFNSDGEFDYYWNPPFENGDALTLVYEESSETYYYNDSEEYGWGGWVDSNGNELSSDFDVVTQYTFNQSYDNQYTYGDYEYVIRVTDPYNGEYHTYRQTFTFAPNPVTGIDVDFAPITLAEGKNCKTATDGEGNEYNHYNFNYFQEGNTITLHTNDGDIVYTCQQREDNYGYMVMDFFDEDGKQLPVENFVFDDHQSTNHWYGGNTYKVDYTYLGHYTTTFEVTITPAPISLEVEGFVGPGPYLENTNGYMTTDANGEQYFHYYGKGLCYEGVTLTVGYEDESYNVTYTAEARYNANTGYTSYVFVDEDGNELQENIYTVDNQATEHWGIGVHAFHYEIFGLSTQDFFVEITEAPKAMVIEGLYNGSATEGTQCSTRTDSNGEQYYEYWLPSVCQEGVTLTFKYDNSPDVVYTAERRYNEQYDYYQWVFVDANGEQLPGYIGTVSDQSENHWDVGEHTYSYSYGNLSQEFTFTVLEAPTEMIIDGLDGGSSKLGENGYNGTDANGEQYFYYWLPSVYQDGVTVTFRYESGAEVVYHAEQRYNEEEDYYENYLADEDGNEVDIRISTVDDQAENHWGVGEHTYSMTYGNLSQEFTFTVKDAPIAFDFAFGPEVSTTFNEGAGGYFDNECGHYIYNLPWPEEEGNTITLYYESGDPVVYTCVKEYNEEEGYYEHYFVNENGERLDEWVYFDDNQAENPFVVGENSVVLCMGNLTTKVLFTVVEGALSMDFVTPYDITIFEKTHGWYAHNDETGADFYYYDMGFIYDEGNTLTLHFADGDKVYVSRLFENVDPNGNTWSDVRYVNINDENDVIGSWDIQVYEYQYEEPWGVGVHEISVGYIGLGTPFEVEILESDVSSIEFIPVDGALTIREGDCMYHDWNTETEKYDVVAALLGSENQLAVTYKDARGRVVYTVAEDPESSDGERWLFDAAGNRLADDFDIFDDQDDAAWGIGQHTATLSFRGVQTAITLNIVEDDWAPYAEARDNNGRVYLNGDPVGIVEGEKLFIYFVTGEGNPEHGVTPFVGFSDGYAEGTLTQAGFTVSTGRASELGYAGLPEDAYGLEIDTTNVPVGTSAPLNFYLYVLDDEADLDNFDYVNSEHALDCSLTVSVIEAPVNDYTVTADRDAVDFGSKCVNNAAPAAQLVVVKNDGDTQLTVLFDEYDFFIVNLESGTATLNPGEWATFSIAPKANLAAGNYTDTVAFRTEQGTGANVAVSFKVTEHSFGNYVPDGNATYDADGTKTRTCTLCGKKETVPDEGSQLIRNGWFDVQGGKSYFVNGVAVTGMQEIGGKTYYFNDNGIMCTGWVALDGDWYYFNADGTIYKGWKQLKNIWYYFGADGKMATGINEINGAAYYFDASGAMKTGLFKVTFEDGYYNWYYANGSGALQSGWQQISKAWYYFVPGEYWMVFGGTAEIGGVTYCFDDNGKMVTGWRTIDGAWYYFNSSGAMLKGWQQISKTWYYFDAEGRMLTGFQTIGGTKYYFNASGAMITGWQKIGNSWYYFAASGAMATGFQTISNAVYYFDENGVMLTGVQEINGATYNFGTSGAALTGWQKLNNVWYYFAASGAMAKGWQKISNVWYYFSDGGKMQTGWRQIGGAWYYFNASGAMQTGWLKQGNSWYYLESSGKMLANTSKKIGNKTYNFNASGVCTNP